MRVMDAGGCSPVKNSTRCQAQLHNYMMTLCSSNPAVPFEIFLYWSLPSFQRSLLLVRLYTQKHLSLCIRFYWHLNLFQNVWDEVKGKRPFVYKDMLSETSFSILLGFTRTIWLLVWCISAGTRSSPCLHRQRAYKRLEAGTRVFGAHDSAVDHSTLLLVFYFRVYWSTMIVVERMQFVNDDAANYLYGCIIHPFIMCGSCFLRALEQCLCVLGLCLMALDVLHRMLGQAQPGRCLKKRSRLCLQLIEYDVLLVML